jgi:hypothetical protein
LETVEAVNFTEEDNVEAVEEGVHPLVIHSSSDSDDEYIGIC